MAAVEWTTTVVEQVFTNDDTGATFTVNLNPIIEAGGTFDGVHNDLSGRSTAGAHPGSAVTLTAPDGTGNLATSVVTAQLLADAVDALDISGGGGGGGVGVQIALMYHTPQDLSSSSLSMAGPFPLPSSYFIGFDNQATSSENGYYPADGAGGVTVGGKVALSDLAFGTPVSAAVAFYGDYTDLPTPWSASQAEIESFRRLRVDALSGTVLGESLVVVPIGAEVCLQPIGGALGWVDSMKFFWMNDFLDSTSTSGDPFILNVHGAVYVAQTAEGDDRYLQLGSHATLVRTVMVHNDGLGDLHIANTPGDGQDFALTLGPGQRCMIWPNQSKWEAWILPPQFADGDDGKVLGWNAEGQLVSVDLPAVSDAVWRGGYDAAIATGSTFDPTHAWNTAAGGNSGATLTMVTHTITAGRFSLFSAASDGPLILDATGLGIRDLTGTVVATYEIPASQAVLLELGGWGDHYYRVMLTSGGSVISVDGQTGTVDLTGNYDPLNAASDAVTAHVGDSDPHAQYLREADDLASLHDAPTARANLGLGDSSTKNVGTGAGTVMAGNDARWQPVDSDLTAIAALSTTTVGRNLLTLATGTAGYVTGADGTAMAIGAPAPGTPSGGSQNYSLPGVSYAGVSTFPLAANTAYYRPFYVSRPIAVDRVICEITTGAAAGKVFALGVYAASAAGQPSGAALIDTGSQAATGTGGKVITVSATLQPGAYLMVISSDGTPTVRAAVPTSTNVPQEIDSAAFGTTGSIISYARSGAFTFGAYPNPGPVWTASLKATGPAAEPLLLMRYTNA